MQLSRNLKAFLDMIAFSEIGPKLLARSDDGYNVIVGGALFHNKYVDHPRILVKPPKIPVASTAAGRYQILARYFDVYKKQLGLLDFGKDAQDAIAVQLIHECGALDDIEDGKITNAIARCKSRWASLPGAGYGQHENDVNKLLAAYKDAGGTLVS